MTETNVSTHIQSKIGEPGEVLRWEWVVVAIGSALIIVAIAILLPTTSINSSSFPYPLAPIALRAQDSISHQFGLTLAGTILVFGDVFLAVGSMILQPARVESRYEGALSSGWAFLAASATIFALADGFTARGLVPLAMAYSQNPVLFQASVGTYDFIFAVASFAGAIGELCIFLSIGNSDR